MNAEFRDISVEEEAFVNNYEANPNDREAAQFLTTTQIHQSLVQKTGHKNLSIQSLGRVLRELKVERGKHGYYVKEK